MHGPPHWERIPSHIRDQAKGNILFVFNHLSRSPKWAQTVFIAVETLRWANCSTNKKVCNSDGASKSSPFQDRAVSPMRNLSDWINTGHNNLVWMEVPIRIGNPCIVQWAEAIWPPRPPSQNEPTPTHYQVTSPSLPAPSTAHRHSVHP